MDDMLISSLNWIIGSRCNLRCSHCDIWQSLNEVELGIEDIIMVLDSAIISESYRFHGVGFDISLGGGEPFMRDDLSQIIHEIKTRYPGALKSISTNGTYLEKMISVLSVHKDVDMKLNISIDGIKGRHDVIRGVPGTFDKVISNIVLIKKIFPRQRIELKLTLMPANHDQIDKVFRLAEWLGCDFSFKPAEVMENYTNRVNGCQSKGKINGLISGYTSEQLCVIRNHSFRLSDIMYNKGLFRKSTFFRDIPFYLAKKRMPVQCSVLRDHLTIMPDGRLHMCIKEDSIGNIRDTFESARSNDSGIPNLSGSSGKFSHKLCSNGNGNLHNRDGNGSCHLDFGRPEDDDGINCRSCMLMCGAYKDYSDVKFQRMTANVEVTVRCNLDCDMCTQKALRHSSRLMRDMGIDDFESIISRYKDKGRPLSHISFLGGEPFLNKDIFMMMHYLDGEGLTYEVTTNCTMLDSAAIDSLKDCIGLSNINFSIDGLKDTHDKIRGQGVFDRCIDAVLLAKGLFNLNICTVVRRDNIDSIPELALFLSGLGIRSMKLILGMDMSGMEISGIEMEGMGKEGMGKEGTEMSGSLLAGKDFEGYRLDRLDIKVPSFSSSLTGSDDSSVRLKELRDRMEVIARNTGMVISYEPDFMIGSAENSVENSVIEESVIEDLGFNSVEQPITECIQLSQYRFDVHGDRIVCEFIRDRYSDELASALKNRPLAICRRCCKLRKVSDGCFQ